MIAQLLVRHACFVVGILLACESAPETGIGCPHEAAAMARLFAESSLPSRSAPQLSGSSLRHVRVTCDWVPEVAENGGLSRGRKVLTRFINIPGSGLTSFWMKPDGEIKGPLDAALEGVPGLSTTLAELRKHSFLLVEEVPPKVAPASSGNKLKDLQGEIEAIALLRAGRRDLGSRDFSLPHLVYFWNLNRPQQMDVKRFEEVNSAFLSQTGPSTDTGEWKQKVAVATVVRGPSGDILVTLFNLAATTENGKLSGTLYVVRKGADCEGLQDALGRLPTGSQLMIFGDDARGTDLSPPALPEGLVVLRRRASLRREIGRALRRVDQVTREVMSRESTTFVNAVPHDPGQLSAMLVPEAGHARWAEFHRHVDAAMEGKYSTRLDSRGSLLSEIQQGDSDVVVVVAHSDGKTLFVGGEPLSVEELAGLPRRGLALSRPRALLLVSCLTGKLADPARNRFLQLAKPPSKTLAEILLEKGFFDLVVAPDHAVDDTEVLRILRDLRLGSPTSHPLLSLPTGWTKLADLFMPKGRVVS